jgi:glutathione S-transferase
MYILYGGRFTRALITEMVMAEAGIVYELRDVDIIEHEHRSAGFLKINPAGRVPVLITPLGDRLYETPAINLFLAERHGAVHLVPEADDPQRGPFLSGLFHLSGELEPAMKRYFYPHRYGAGVEDAPAVRKRALEEVVECVAVIDGRLAANGPFHLGPRFSLVDIMLAYWGVSLEEPDALDAFPALRGCIERVTARPKLQPLFGQLDLSMKEFHVLRQKNAGGS